MALTATSTIEKLSIVTNHLCMEVKTLIALASRRDNIIYIVYEKINVDGQTWLCKEFAIQQSSFLYTLLYGRTNKGYAKVSSSIEKLVGLDYGTTSMPILLSSRVVCLFFNIK